MKLIVFSKAFRERTIDELIIDGRSIGGTPCCVWRAMADHSYAGKTCATQVGAGFAA